MKQITEMNSISEMAGISFDCDCGRKHSVDIGKIYIENQGVPEEVLKSVSQFKEQEILLVADTNTYKVYGSYVFSLTTSVYILLSIDSICFNFDSSRLTLSFSSRTESTVDS
jgi:hypothetical protein